jgi:hypothetical protein
MGRPLQAAVALDALPAGETDRGGRIGRRPVLLVPVESKFGQAGSAEPASEAPTNVLRLRVPRRPDSIQRGRSDVADKKDGPKPNQAPTVLPFDDVR